MTELAALAASFDELADGYDHGRREEIARSVIAWVAPCPDETVADVACWAGAVRSAPRQGPRPDTARLVPALDLSPRMIADDIPGLIPVRDSKRPDADVLRFRRAASRAFLRGLC